MLVLQIESVRTQAKYQAKDQAESVRRQTKDQAKDQAKGQTTAMAASLEVNVTLSKCFNSDDFGHFEGTALTLHWYGTPSLL